MGKVLNRASRTTMSLLQNVSPPLAAIALQLQWISPEWMLTIGYGAGLLAVFRELAAERGKELLEDIAEHKTEFKESIIKTQEFKAIFLNIWEMHIRENSESKRKRLRKFLLALGRGEQITTDLHSKIYSVIQQMTDREAEVFGIIFRASDKNQFKNMNLNSTSIPGLSDYLETDLQDIYNSLHAYRLITIAPEPAIGSLMAVRQITNFGEIFYEKLLQENN